MNRFKTKGFSILEVLFALVIFTAASSSIFIFMKNMLNTTKKTKERSIKIEQYPLVFSARSPLIDQGNAVENIKEKSLIEIYKKEKIKINNLEGIEQLYLKNNTAHDREQQSGNFIFNFPPEEHTDEKK